MAYFSSTHTLNIHTYPRDATIKIDPMETEFKQGMQLKPRKYTISVSKPGYSPHHEEIMLFENTELDISLEQIDTPIFKAVSKPLPKPVSKPVPKPASKPAPPKSKCDNGDSTACYKQGRDYYKGIGVEKNYQKAAHYFLKGCDLGNSASCLNIGVMYYQGQGVAEDVNKAVIFLNKACKLGNKDACDNLKALGNL